MSLISEKQSAVFIFTHIANIGQSLGYVIEYTSEIKQGKMEPLQEGESLLKNRKWFQDKLPCFLRHTVPVTWLEFFLHPVKEAAHSIGSKDMEGN